MLEDSDISLLVTQKHLAADLPAGRFSTVFVDARELKNASFNSANPEPTDSADHPCCMRKLSVRSDIPRRGER
jgi:hypothetical protein